MCQEAQPWALGMLPPAVSQQPCGAGLTFVIPISQLRKLKLKEVNEVSYPRFPRWEVEDLGVGLVDGAPCLPPWRTAAPSQTEFVSGGGWVVLGLMLERDTATKGIFTNQGILT